MSTHRLLQRKAAEEAPANAASSTVLDFVRRHQEEVLQSDKEAPERIQELRPVDGPVDPSYFLVPKELSGSPDQQAPFSVNRNRVFMFMKRFGDQPGVFPITGDHGYFGVAIRISAITPDTLSYLQAVEDSTSDDDVETSKAVHARIDEAWNDWAHYDFIRALEAHLPDQEEAIDALDADQSRELFDRVRRSLKVEWTEDSDSVFIDVVDIAGAVRAGDLHD